MTTLYKRNEDFALLKFAKESKMDGYFNDVTIQAGNECLPANRMVLACYSPFFNAMFKSELKERYENTVEINHGDGHFIKQLIDYIYDGEIQFDNSNVMDILSAADFLQLNGLVKSCLDHIEKNIEIENCCDLFEVAEKYQSSGLKMKLNKFMSENLKEISDGFSFKSCDKEKVMKWLKNLDRYLVYETTIYFAILNWVKHDTGRDSEFASLFELLELNKLPSKFLEEVVSHEMYVKQNLSCMNSVLQVVSRQLKQLRIQENKASIVAVGGFLSDKQVFGVYSCFGETASCFPPLPRGSCVSCSIKFDSCLYVFGGSPSSKKAENSVFKLTLNKTPLSWNKVAEMWEKRSKTAAAVFDDVIVLSGGDNGVSTVASSEYYIPSRNSWKRAADLNQTRSGHALVECDGLLYAIGGKSNEVCLSSVEMLESLDSGWKVSQPMNVARNRLAAVSWNNIIYAFGGQSGVENSTTTNSAEMFDPSTNQWSYVKSMEVPRSGFSATVMQGRVFVVGGLNTEKVAVKVIECYNPVRDSWTVVCNIDIKLFYHSAIAI